MRHIFIMNPVAGKRDQTAELRAEIEAVFSTRKDRFLIEPTLYAGHAIELAQRYARDGDALSFYACGGDGTLGEVVRGMYHAPNCRVAPVPIGTGNDFVKCFGAGAAKEFRSIQSLLDGHAESVDLLRVGERVSLNIVSAGLDASIAQNVNRFKRWPLISGHMAYQLSLAYCFCTSLKNRYAFEIDGQRRASSNYIFAVAANGRYYGGGFMAAPLSDMQDGLIDFICVPSIGHLRALSMIGSYKRGEHLEKYSFIKLIRCQSLRIFSDQSVCLNVDGEIIPMRNPEITVLPGAVSLILPHGCTTALRTTAICGENR